MPIHDSEPARARPLTVGLPPIRRFLAGLLAATSLCLGGCGKDPAHLAIETDAHGYMCQKCAGKFFTGPKVFLESKCPKCQQAGLVDVIGYWCDKDKRMTIRPNVSGPEGASVCEQCGVHLQNAMVLPREKDLSKWGATKTGPM